MNRCFPNHFFWKSHDITIISTTPLQHSYKNSRIRKCPRKLMVVNQVRRGIMDRNLFWFKHAVHFCPIFVQNLDPNIPFFQLLQLGIWNRYISLHKLDMFRKIQRICTWILIGQYTFLLTKIVIYENKINDEKHKKG